MKRTKQSKPKRNRSYGNPASECLIVGGATYVLFTAADQFLVTGNSRYNQNGNRFHAASISVHQGYSAFGVSDFLQQEFDSLAQTWRRETGHYSLVQQKILHPAYLQIIGMGQNALPFLINEIQHGSNHWFPALRAIAGSERPLDEGSSFEEAVETWVRWWNSRRYRYAGMDFTF